MLSSNHTEGTRTKSDMALLREVTNRYCRDQKENLPPSRATAASTGKAGRQAELANVSCASQCSSVFSLTPGPKASVAPAQGSTPSALRGTGASSHPSRHAINRGLADVSADLSVSQTLMPAGRSSELSPGKRAADGVSPMVRHDDSVQFCFNAMHEHSLQTNSSVDETPVAGGLGALDLALDELLRGFEWSDTPAAVPMADEDADEGTGPLEASATALPARAGLGWAATPTRLAASTSGAVSPQQRIAAALRALGTPTPTPAAVSAAASPSALLLPPDDLTGGAGFAPDGTASSVVGHGFAHRRTLLESDDDSEGETAAAKPLGVTRPLARARGGLRSALPGQDDSLRSEMSDHAAQLGEQEIERLLDSDLFAPPCGVFTVTAGSLAEAGATTQRYADAGNLAAPAYPRRPFTVTSPGVKSSHAADELLSPCEALIPSRPTRVVDGDGLRGPVADGCPSVSARPKAVTRSGGTGGTGSGGRADLHAKVAPGLLITVGGRRVPVDTLHLLHVPPQEVEGAGPSVRRKPCVTASSASLASHTTTTVTGRRLPEPSARPRAPLATVTVNTRGTEPPPYACAVAPTPVTTTRPCASSNAANLLVTLQIFATDTNGRRVSAQPAFVTVHANHAAETDALLKADGVSPLTIGPTPLRVKVGGVYLAHMYSSESAYEHVSYKDVGVCTAISEEPRSPTSGHDNVKGVLLREMDVRHDSMDTELLEKLKQHVQRVLAATHRQCAIAKLPFVLDKLHITFDRRVCVVYFKPSTEDASHPASANRFLSSLKYQLACKVYLRWTSL